LKKTGLTYIAAKIPSQMADLLDQAVEADTYSCRSELIRDALRRELERLGFIKVKEPSSLA
jgi:Arc/MetJ-type ribon-helix-helix transcriptional regulator